MQRSSFGACKCFHLLWRLCTWLLYGLPVQGCQAKLEGGWVFVLYFIIISSAVVAVIQVSLSTNNTLTFILGYQPL